MTTFTETLGAGGFIISEAAGNRSRDNVTLDSSVAADMVPGTVLGKITATGKYAAYDQQASDGTQAAAAILINWAESTLADQVVAVLNTDAEVNGDELTWLTGSPADVTAGVADLLALGIKVR
jgi:hypothetical protein